LRWSLARVGIFGPDLDVGTGADSDVTEVNRTRQMKQEARKWLKIVNTAMSTMALHIDTQRSGRTFETKREIEALAVKERPRRLNVYKVCRGVNDQPNKISTILRKICERKRRLNDVERP
jgi:hypothetical protein